MIQAILDELTINFAQQADGYEVDGKVIQPSIQKQNNQLYYVMHDNRSYTIFVHKVDRENKSVDLSINGKRQSVQIRSRIDQLLKQLGMEDAMTKKLDSLKAPMPGLIHSFKVNEGDSVQKGDPILILEAMKMENVIKAPGDGVIKTIHVTPKDSVEKNELLVSFA
ncbi:MAG: acetyl-CoA carboxylase biotin carboxyl carrier protein subunit [Bacteroidota bacterium]